MRAQLGKLIDAAGQPNITLQVLPFTAGLAPGHVRAVPIFRFAGPDSPTSSTASP